MSTPERSSAEKDKKYKLLYVYAFFKADGPEGVHEDLLEDATIEDALNHAKNLWIGADEYRTSEKQLPDPYHKLFSGK